jgi:hypothetical protein
MAEEGTLAINADVVKEAGTNATAANVAEAYTNYYIKKAESYICMLSKYDWVTNYANATTIGKELLREFVSCYAAMMAIKQDMSPYTSGQEALIMVNILWARVMEVKNLMRDKDIIALMKIA